MIFKKHVPVLEFPFILDGADFAVETRLILALARKDDSDGVAGEDGGHHDATCKCRQNAKVIRGGRAPRMWLAFLRERNTPGHNDMRPSRTLGLRSDGVRWRRAGWGLGDKPQ